MRWIPLGRAPSRRRLRLFQRSSQRALASRRSVFLSGHVVGLNDDDLLATAFLQFGVEPVVKAANFEDSHEAASFSGSFDEFGEKIVKGIMFGTDLTGLNDITVFVPQIDGDLGLVKVDTKVKHGGLRG